MVEIVKELIFKEDISTHKQARQDIIGFGFIHKWVER